MKKKRFIDILAEKLQEGNIGEMEIDKFMDGSSCWINLRRKNKCIEIDFDRDGEKITQISVWKDIVEVVDTKQIF